MSLWKRILFTCIVTAAMFGTSLLIAGNPLSYLAWEDIIFLKPLKDRCAEIIVIMYFLFICQMIQVYAHMGRYARTRFAVMIAVKMSRRGWLKEKNHEMWLRSFFLIFGSYILFSIFLKKIPPASFLMYYASLVYGLSLLTYSEVFLKVLVPNADISIYSALFVVGILVIDLARPVGLIVYTAKLSVEIIRFIVIVCINMISDIVFDQKLKKKKDLF